MGRRSTQEEEVMLEHDADDPPPSGEWTYWDYFNRWAEQCAAIARAWGFLP